ncbi:hypothetical protein [Kutzneria buriramensis]|uniref:Uncharacterized protein n=1 Tax=Kutzneria buriramensis TaxID=1045776 RepID=A0A3E0G4P9_9PSEU|nr:hypothetical protein [Kutzneria buriramensis]REH17443.1 hypothetical protein BCF44_14715 [Kutzneria buriramensis]
MTSKLEQASKKMDQIIAMLGAQDLAEIAGGLAHDVYLKAVDETRVEVAKGVEAHMLSTKDRGMYNGESPDYCIVQMLTEEPTTEKDGTVTPPLVTDEKLRELGKDFALDGVDDVFRQGMKFALLLVGSLDYDI